MIDEDDEEEFDEAYERRVAECRRRYQQELYAAAPDALLFSDAVEEWIFDAWCVTPAGDVYPVTMCGVTRRKIEGAPFGYFP